MAALAPDMQASLTFINSTLATLASVNVSIADIFRFNCALYVLANTNDTLLRLLPTTDTAHAFVPRVLDAQQSRLDWLVRHGQHSWLAWIVSWLYCVRPVAPLTMWAWFIGYHLPFVADIWSWVASLWAARKRRLHQEELEMGLTAKLKMEQISKEYIQIAESIERVNGAQENSLREARCLFELASKFPGRQEFEDLAVMNWANNLRLARLFTDIRNTATAGTLDVQKLKELNKESVVLLRDIEVVSYELGKVLLQMEENGGRNESLVGELPDKDEMGKMEMERSEIEQSDMAEP